MLQPQLSVSCIALPMHFYNSFGRHASPDLLSIQPFSALLTIPAKNVWRAQSATAGVEALPLSAQCCDLWARWAFKAGVGIARSACFEQGLGYKECVTVGPLILNRGTPARVLPQKAPAGHHCAKVGVLQHHHADS